MRIRATAIWVVGVVFASTLFAMSSSESADAVGPCAGNHNGAQVGYFGYTAGRPNSWAEDPEGVSAYVYPRVGPVCGNMLYPYTFSTDWVMLQDRGTTNHYAQSGQMYDNTAGCSRVFTEWNTGGGFRRDIQACTLSGVNITARVEYQGAPGPYPPCCSTMILSAQQPGGYSLIDVANFDPWNLGWAFQPTFAGEVDWSPANDVPGALTAKADISAMGIQRVTTGGLVTIPCYLLQYEQGAPNPNVYFSDAVACNHIRVWTNPQ